MTPEEILIILVRDYQREMNRESGNPEEVLANGVKALEDYYGAEFYRRFEKEINKDGKIAIMGSGVAFEAAKKASRFNQ